MFFKNLTVYKTPVGWLPTGDQLARGVFTACGDFDSVSRGWIAPRNDDNILPMIAGHALLVLQIEERMLPASVISREVQKRADKMEEDQGYKPGRKQLKELRERIVEELTPKAFTKLRRTFVWIDPQNGTLAIDTSSPSKADEVIEHLRYCLEEFPLKPYHTQVAPTSAMADWLAGGEAPAGFTIDRDLQLKSVGKEKAAVSYQRCPLDDQEQEIKAHLAAGKLPTKLAMTYDDRVSFILNEKGNLSRIFPLNITKEDAQDAESAAEQFEVDFTLMAGEYSRLINAIAATLGGVITE